jgi:hypothetical protein
MGQCHLLIGSSLGLLIVALLQPPAVAQSQPAVACNVVSDLVDGTGPRALRPVDDKLLTAGLPCQEAVNLVGPDPAKTPLENLQRGFDFYSWLTFIALNAPADESKSVKDARPDTRTKWEDIARFRQLADVMLPDGKAPVWGTRRAEDVPPVCRDQLKAKPDLMLIQMIEETYNQPFKTGPLIDQNGNYALFDILLNRQMFDYIAHNKLFSRAAQMSNPDLKVDFPAGVNPKDGNPGDPGTVMLKVSWRILDAAKDNKDRFHTVDALIFVPGSEDGKTKPACVRKTLGLVGFHVGHKTKSRLQWIWTSFEHVDNVPEQKDVDARRLNPRYSFYDPSCPPAKCLVNQTPPPPWEPPATLKFRGAFKSQITRVVPLTDDTKEMNRKFQQLLQGTVWANYMLLSTQWPTDFNCAGQTDKKRGIEPNTDFDKEPDMVCAPAPPYLANSTLETYTQGTTPLASSSCMACHANATSFQPRPATGEASRSPFNQSDFTFTLEKAH